MLGTTLTVSVAALDVAGEQGEAPLTTTSNDPPESPPATPVKVSVAVVAPLTVPPLPRFTPPLRHWYVNEVPVAVTAKLTVLPEHTVCALGETVTVGGLLTVNVAALEVADAQGAAPLTTTSKLLPLSPAATPVKVNVAVVAPLTVPPLLRFTPPLRH
jgi:hypothetical protein